MNKYLLFLILLVLAIALDLGSKTLAEKRLASHSQDYEHYIYLDVPEQTEAGTLGELLAEEFAWSSDEEIDEVARSSFIVNEAGEIMRRGSTQLVLQGGERVEVRQRRVNLIDGFLSLRYVENRGAAWGFLSGSDHSFRQPFFIAVGVVAIVVIFLLFRSVGNDRKLLVTALALIVGGAVGNIVDRIRYGYVVDFISWRPGFEWPTFNIADALIVVGVGMMFIEVIRDQVRERRKKREEALASET